MNEFDLFQSALDLEDPADRESFLMSACGHDPALMRRVEALLASHDEQSQFLNTPVVEQISDATDREDAVTMLAGDVSTQDDEPDATAELLPGSAPMKTHQPDSDDEIPLNYLEPSAKPGSLGRLAHYEVLEVIGRGAFGTVLRAFDEKLQRVVAIKVMSPEMASTSPARKRFIREAQASAAVRHENVVSVHAVEENPIPYLVMDYIPGQNLQQRLDERGPLDVLTVLRLGRQIAEGLAAAHAQDLIHRDVKPANILLEAGLREMVKVSDFGLARAADDASVTQSGIIAGTPMYMAPEQALGKKLDQRADLFSFGSVLYQMMSGRPPFRAANTLAVLKRLNEDTPRPIREIIPESPQWLCDIITKLHAKNPDERYQSAQEVADVLANCEFQLKAHSGLRDFSMIPVPSEEKAPAGRRGQWLTVAAILFLLSAFGLYSFTRPPAKSDVAANGTIKSPSSDLTSSGSQPSAATSAVVPTAAAQAQAGQAGSPPTFKNHIGMEFVRVPKGKSWLGGGQNRLGDKEVEIQADFYMGKYEVTQDEWEKVMGENPSHFSRAGNGLDRVQDISDIDLKRFPVDNVTWDQCQVFIEKLNKSEAEKGWKYRLPNEVEWEYACRGGPMPDKEQSAFDFYLAQPTNALVLTAANFNSGTADSPLGENRSSKVGSFAPNALGLYDMHGSQWEWCEDADTTLDGDRGFVIRGGSWGSPAEESNAAFRTIRLRTNMSESHGLRLVRVPTLPATFKNRIGMEFVIVPSGKSWLGGSKDTLGDKQVEIPADFYLGKYEVTQEEWEKVMGDNPSNRSRTGLQSDTVKDISDADLKRFPAERLTWDECQLFASKLNQLTNETGWVYRLPTELEWEYACRGGMMQDRLASAFDFYFTEPTNALLPEQASTILSDQANVDPDKVSWGGYHSRKVGTYTPNVLGLFDMHGNVHEWCSDTVQGADGATTAVLRGGSSGDGYDGCRAAGRREFPPSARDGNVGVRLARFPSPSSVALP